MAGDVAVINAGTVSASGLIDRVAIQINQANGAAQSVTLALSGVTLDAAFSLTVNNGQLASTAAPVVVAVSAATTFAGTESFYGTQTQFQIAGGSTLTLAAGGHMNFYGSSPVTAGPGTLVNNGTIALLNPGRSLQTAIFNAPMVGTGLIALGENARLEITGSVASGESIAFNDGTVGNETLQLDTPSQMGATIQGFSASDRMFLFNTSYDSFSYVQNGAGTGGTLNLTSGGAVTASLLFSGQYTQNQFTVTPSGTAGTSGYELTITTTSTANSVSIGLPDGYQNGGSGPAALPVYRFFDTIYGTHLFTQSVSEAQSIVANRLDLTQETNGFGAVAPSSTSAEAVYRFFEQANGTHFFTANQSEFLGLTTPGSASYRSDFTYESSSTFYEHASAQSGDVAVYRLFDAVKGTQFLTGDQGEYAGLTTAGSASYRADLKPEGIAFYAPQGTFHT